MASCIPDEQIIKKYTEIAEKKFMSMEEAIVLSRYLASRIAESGNKPDVVVGIASGALLISRVISDKLGVPHEIITIRRRGSRIKHILQRNKFLLKIISILYLIPVVKWPLIWTMKKFEALEVSNTQMDNQCLRNKNIALIDDCIESGKTLSVAQYLLSKQGADHVIVAVISWSDREDSAKKNNVVPDIFICRRIHHYPWSRNSPYFSDFLQWVRNNAMGQWV